VTLGGGAPDGCGVDVGGSVAVTTNGLGAAALDISMPQADKNRSARTLVSKTNLSNTLDIVIHGHERSKTHVGVEK
jgi:hypothetical protein